MNENNKAVAIGAVVVGVLLSAALYFKTPDQVNVVNNIPEGNQNSQSFGAVSGPDSFSPYYTENGLARYPFKAGILAATTTPCAFYNSYGTTTIARVGFNSTVSTSTALTVTVATSTSPNATTSAVTNFSIAANAKGAFSYGPGSNIQEAIVWPNTWVVIGVKGGAGVAGGVTLTGSCHLVLNGF